MNIYLKEMQDYLEILATFHADVLHTIDGSGNRAFARFQSDEQVEEIQQKGSKNFLVITDYYGQIIGEYDEQKMRQVMRIRFACKASNGDDQTTRINNATVLAFRIMLDFYLRLRYDFEEDNCGVLKYVDLAGVTWEPFEGPWLDSDYGFDLEIPFKAYLPALDENKWTDLAA